MEAFPGFPCCVAVAVRILPFCRAIVESKTRKNPQKKPQTVAIAIIIITSTSTSFCDFIAYTNTDCTLHVCVAVRCPLQHQQIVLTQRRRRARKRAALSICQIPDCQLPHISTFAEIWRQPQSKLDGTSREEKCKTVFLITALCSTPHCNCATASIRWLFADSFMSRPRSARCFVVAASDMSFLPLDVAVCAAC